MTKELDKTMRAVRLANPIRFIVVTAACLVVAGLVAMQTTGIVFTRKAPDRAVMIFPMNGIAKENVASALFQVANAEAGAELIVGKEARRWARSSYLSEPLTPVSLGILSLTLPKAEERRAFLERASRVSRRDKLMQGLLLQEHVQANDYMNTIKTLDDILTVRPSRSAELFPVLLAVFSEDSAAVEFAKVLDGSSPWHGNFVTFALKHPAALPNLSRLRSRTTFEDQKQDQVLIQNLAKAGELDRAYDLYNRIGSSPMGKDDEVILSWSSTYPPFDWEWADSADFRAQPSLDSGNLEIYIRPGNGGVFAERLVRAPSTPFRVALEHKIASSSSLEDMDVKVTCAPSDTSLGSSDFSPTGTTLFVPDLPRDCRFLIISLSGRAWTGRAPVRGDIQPIEIKLLN